MKIKNILLISVMILLIVAPVVSAESKLQMWRNASTGTNVSWVDNNGNWYMLGDLTIDGSLIGNSSIWSKSGTNIFPTTLTDYIGIGTSSPSAKLDVNGNSRFRGNMRLDDGYTFDFGDGTTALYGNGASDFFGIKTNTLTRMYIDSSGNVGIGTSSPGKTLDVVGAIRANDRITADGSVIIPAFNFYSDTNSGLYPISADKIGLATNGTNAITIDDSQNVGIGTSSPTTNYGKVLHIASPSTNGAELHLTDTAGETTTDGFSLFQYGSETYVYNRENGNMRFGTNNIEKMRIDSSGNVGIGTSSPTANLEVKASTDSDNNLFNITNNNGNTIFDVNTYLDYGYASIRDETGAIKIRLDSTGNSWFNAGKVGIGTSSPSAKVDIESGDISSLLELTKSREDDISMFSIYTSTTGRDASMSFETNGGNQFVMGIDADDADKFKISDSAQLGTTDRLTIDSSGNVGIGTSNPTSLLHLEQGDLFINGTTHAGVGTDYDSFNNGIGFADTFSAGNFGALITGVNTGDWGGNLQFVTRADAGGSGVERMRIDASGNVGIGTSSPSAKLEVAGKVALNDASVAGWIQSDGSLRLDIDNNNDNIDRAFVISKHNGVSNLMIVQEDGNVGIGTSSPQNKLNVLGDLNITGALYSEGGGIMTGQYDFNGGWTSNGLSIIDGDIYAQTAYFYNITGLDVQTLKINGSLLPQEGYDNNFDIGSGSLRWKDLYLGGDANVSGVVYRNNKPLIDWSEATNGTLFTQALWDTNYSANNDIWTTTNSEIWTVVANDTFVPYTGSNANVVLGDYNLSVNNSVFFVDSTNDRVGIGTDSPDTLLTIEGTSSSSEDALLTLRPATGHTGGTIGQIIGGIKIETQDPGNEGLAGAIYSITESTFTTGDRDAGLAFYTSASTTTSERMRIDSSGNVGIGTSSPGASLEVEGTVNPSIWISNTNSNEVDSGALRFAEAGGSAYFELQHDGSANKLHLYSSNLASEVMTWERLTGNVGIGTSSPDTLLHLKKTSSNAVLTVEETGAGNFAAVISTKTDDNDLSLASRDDGYTSVPAYTGKNTIQSTGGNLVLSSWEADSDIEFYAGDRTTPKMYLNGSTGNVGIGTSSPAQKLDVSGGNIALDNTYGIHIRDAGGTRRWAMQIDAGDDLIFGDFAIDDILFDVGSKAAAMVIKQTTGNVGIGTSSPGSILDIRQTNLPRITLVKNGIISWYMGNPTQSTSNYFTIGTDSGGNTEILTLTNTGKVGIGTSSPLSLLSLESNTVTAYDETSDSGQDNIGSTLTIENLNTTANSFSQLNMQVSSSSNRAIGRIVTIAKGSATSDMAFVTEDAGTKAEKLRILGDGNVGIGTSSPGAKLDIHTATNTNGILIREDTDDSITHNLYVDGSDDGQFIMYANGQYAKISLNTAGNSYFNGGNVGIGTSSPNAPLTISDGISDEFDFDISTNLMTIKTVTADGSDNQAIRIDAGAGGASSTRGAYIQLNGNEATNTGKVILQSGNVVGAGILFRKSGGIDAMFMDKDGLIGIGTTSPSDELSVVGTVNATAYQCADGTNDCITDLIGTSDYVPYTGSNANVVLGDYNLSVNNSVFFVDSTNDRVGIGTSSPSTTLHVYDSIANAITIDGPAATFRDLRFSTDDSLRWLIRTTNAAETGSNVGSDFQIWSRDDSGNALDSSAFVIKRSTGNVGIGTTSPASALDVKGIIQASGGGSGFRVNRRDTGAEAWISYSADGDLNFYDSVDTTTKVTFEQGGNVGIGTTSPGAKLEVDGTGNTSILSLMSTTNVLNEYETIRFGTIPGTRTKAEIRTINTNSGNSAGDLAFLTNSGASLNEAIRITSSGKVGIGTSSPGAKLEVVDGQINIKRTRVNIPLISLIDITNSKSWNLENGRNSVDSFGIYQSGGGTRLTIDSSGNVGIGTTSPGTNIVGTYDYPSTVTTLQIDGNTYGRIISRGSSSGGLDLIDSGTGTNKKWMQLVSDGGITKFKSFSDTGSIQTDNILTLNHSNGNVGIGTSSPVSLLNTQIPYTRTDTTLRHVTFEGSNDADFKVGLVTSITGGATGDDRSASLGVRTYNVGTTSFGITQGNLNLQESGGNVGIGTSSPGAKLEVTGDVIIDLT